MTGSQCQSATYDLAVSRLNDLGGFPDCLVPDSGVGVAEGSFGGMEPGGNRGPPLDGDGGAPALVEVADGEDAVFLASLCEGVLDFLENSGSRDGATVATAWRRAGSDSAGIGINGSSPCGYSAVNPARLLSRPATE